MKIRTAFVSNSSSSSFIISKNILSPKQIQSIYNHIEESGYHDWDEDMGMDYIYSDRWLLREENGFIIGTTWLDNFDMSDWFEKIGVPLKEVVWGDIGEDMVRRWKEYH